ncbi:hypothetical protein [Fibrella aquatilis]|uniref:TANFOR domain-containing protein n=1 Tax=Fibrella aquatilis TaxID=2817059 RepID=A0A939JXK5_9BACT|nr:hypothetical protein [Fibrella aquatilis]MBO0929423.1 hypothetical protein [Fibrella aquatilis]
MASLFKSNKPIRFLFQPYRFIILLFAANFAHAQNDVQITISVLPPYSAYIQDYAGAGKQVQIFVRNTTTARLNVRLQGSVTGDNGVVIQTVPNYRPPVPLTLEPLQNRLLNYADLSGLFDLNQLDVQGVDRNNLYKGLPLPEGSYQLCIRAFDNATSRPLSPENPLGCSPPFPIKAVEPPILIAPLCDNEVQPLTPQNLIFTWTPPIGVSPAMVDYTLRIVELPQIDVDPNVFIDAVVLPKSGLEVKNLRTSTFLYSVVHPPLVVGKRYAWRVQSRDLSGRTNFLNDGKSPVCLFTYGKDLPADVFKPGYELVQTPVVPKTTNVSIAPANTPPAAATAIASKVQPQQVAEGKMICKAVELPDSKNSQSGSLNGKTIKLGEYDLTINQAAFSKEGYTGDGRVNWNNVPIKVTFSKLKVNGQNQVFDGTVVSDNKGPKLPNVSLGQLPSYANLPNNYFDQVQTKLDDAIAQAKQAGSVPLPLKYDGKLGKIGVNQMQFSPVGAQMDMVLGVAIPGAPSNKSMLLLATTNVCIRPQQKVPTTGTVYLVSDFALPIPGASQTFTFKKSDPNSGTPGGTYAKITNGDFDKIHAVLDLNLGGTLLKLDDGQGGTKPGDVVATLTADFVKWQDWVGAVTLPSFQLPGISGVTFTGNDVIYDHSDLTNPDNFTLPAEYKGEKGPTFQGIFFKKVTVELPKSFKNNPRIAVGVNGGIVDNSGFTGLIAAASKPILDYNKAAIAGFGFGIDDFQWTIVQNSNRGGNILGKLQFPISTDAFSYSCNLSGGFDAIQFTASPKDGYDVPLFAALMDLNANTTISVTYKSGQDLKVSMKVCGKVSINVKKFAGNGTVGKIIDGIVPKLCFQDFLLTNMAAANVTAIGGSGLYASAGTWKLDTDCAKASDFGPSSGGKAPKNGGGPWSPDDDMAMWLAPDEAKPTLAGFPLDFDPPSFVNTKEGTGVRLGVGLHLGEAKDDNSFVQAHGSVDILGTITKGDRFVPSYAGTYPRSLSINGSVGPLTVSGGLDFIKSNTTYGDGIKGRAEVKIPGFDVKLKMMMLFGNVNGYKYGFVDGSAQFPGIPIVGPVLLTGLGGGMHYNMTMMVNGVDATSTPDQVTKLAKTSNDLKTEPAIDLLNPGQTMSGASFTPKQGGWGFTAKVYAGLADPHVFNSSLAMSIDFAGGTLGGINLHGNANVISTSGDGDGSDGVVHATMDVTYAQSQFDAGLSVQAKFLTATVEIPFSMHVASKSDWCVKLGDPNPANKRISVTLFDLNAGPVSVFLKGEAYLAAGIGPSLGGLPPVPKVVSDFLQTGENTLSEAKSAYNARKMPNLAPVGGSYKLLFGAAITGGLKVDVEPFRLSGNATVGFDVAVMKDQSCGEDPTVKPVGISGWYGMGQAFAHVGAKIELYVDTWFFSGSLTLMKLQAGALFKAGLPNPNWADGRVKVAGEVLDGLISVETTQDFAFGEKCTPVYTGDPLKDIEIISQITPEEGTTDVSTLPTMAVAFNMPMNKTFEIYLNDDDIRYYKFMASTPAVTVKPTKGSKTTLTDLTPLKWSPDYRSCTLSAKSYQPSLATIQLTQSVTIKELVGGKYGSPQDPLNVDTGKREARSQLKSASFTLGKQPETVPLETITKTWPINGQQYFLKGHQPTGMLEATVLKGLECIVPGPDQQLTARFRGADGSQLASPITYDGDKTLTFAIPTNLKNEQPYTLEMSMQAKSKSSAPSGALATSSYVTMAQSPKLQLYRTTLNVNAVQALAAANEANQAKIVFSLGFGTSKHNTFAEKLNALNLKATDYKGDQEIFIKPATELYERFDKIDLFNNSIYPNFTSARLLNYATPFGNTPYDNEVRTMIYDKMKILAEDGTGTYNAYDPYNPQSDDFKLSSLAQLQTGSDPYDRDVYSDPNGISSVGGAPQRVLLLNLTKATYNPFGTPMSWRFVRDKLAYWDLVALSGIMQALVKLNNADVRGGKQYSSDKGMSDQAYLTKYYHDPNAESCGIYTPIYSKPAYIDGNGKNQPASSWPNPNYKMIDGVTYDGSGRIIASSPYSTLIINEFKGGFYRKQQYWKFAEDNYYKVEGYTDNKGVDHYGGPERGKNSPITVVFSYGPGGSVKSTTKTITIGSINDPTLLQVFMQPVFYPFNFN